MRTIGYFQYYREFLSRSVLLSKARVLQKDGPGELGGQSWTVEWLKFDNSYFKDMKFLSQIPWKEQKEQDLLALPTDAALFEDPSFKVYAEKYAEDQEAFFKDYAEAHAKLNDLGQSLILLRDSHWTMSASS